MEIQYGHEVAVIGWAKCVYNVYKITSYCNLDLFKAWLYLNVDLCLFPTSRMIKHSADSDSWATCGRTSILVNVLYAGAIGDFRADTAMIRFLDSFLNAFIVNISLIKLHSQSLTYSTTKSQRSGNALMFVSLHLRRFSRQLA